MTQVPQEPQTLERFIQALAANAFEVQPQILLRPHPIGGGARFQGARERHPDLLFTETNSDNPSSLGEWFPSLDDIKVQVNSIAHADVTINLWSTMTLDACALDRPVVNVAFEDTRGSPHDHYECVGELGSARVASNVDELVREVARYLEDPTLESQNRGRLLDLQCGRVDGRASVRAAERLLSLVYSAPRCDVG